MLVVKKNKARQFLEDEVAPVLLPALVQMKHARPRNPVEWLADWLTLYDSASNKQ